MSGSDLSCGAKCSAVVDPLPGDGDVAGILQSGPGTADEVAAGRAASAGHQYPSMMTCASCGVEVMSVATLTVASACDEHRKGLGRSPPAE